MTVKYRWRLAIRLNSEAFFYSPEYDHEPRTDEILSYVSVVFRTQTVIERRELRDGRTSGWILTKYCDAHGIIHKVL